MYTADLLTALGIPCRHEDVFGISPQPADPKIGESSWASAPFLPDLPKEVLVLHQYRDPVRTISSNVRAHRMGSRDDRPLQIHRALADEHCPGLPRHDLVKRETEFYFRWHQLIEANTSTRPQISYRVEDLDVIQVRKILERLDETRTDDEINEALKSTSKRTNTLPGASQSLPLRFTREQRELASRWGY